MRYALTQIQAVECIVEALSISPVEIIRDELEGDSRVVTLRRLADPDRDTIRRKLRVVSGEQDFSGLVADLRV